MPPNWQAFDRGMAVVLKSATEPGVVIITFQFKTTMEQLNALYQQGYREEGLALMPAAAATKIPAGRNEAIAGVYTGRSADGIQLRCRVAGVLSPFGTAATVMSLATDKDYAAMERLVDTVAQSFTFAKPKDSGLRQVLAGNYSHYSSSQTYASSSSSESSINLCLNGNFSRGGESYTSAQAGTAYGQRSGGGTWTAQGNQMQGVLILTHANGQQEQLPYQVSTNPKDRSGYGPALQIGGTLYQKTGAGACN